MKNIFTYPIISTNPSQSSMKRNTPDTHGSEKSKKILKAARETRHLPYGQTIARIITEFSSEVMEAQ